MDIENKEGALMDELLYFGAGLLFVAIVVGLPLFFVMRSINRNGGTALRKQKVFNIIASHRVFTVVEISKLSGISQKKLIPTLRFIVSEANTNIGGIGQNISFGGIEINNIVQTSFLGDVKFLRGSRLCLDEMRIILAEDNSNESWHCLYCKSKNLAEDIVCCACGARRQA